MTIRSLTDFVENGDESVGFRVVDDEVLNAGDFANLDSILNDRW
jgi:hypothetical protein